MDIHRLNGPVVTMIAAGIALAVALVIAARHSEIYRLGGKGDRLEAGAPQADCSQVVWPYGCEWMDASSGPKKHARGDRTRRHYHGLRRSYERD